MVKGGEDGIFLGQHSLFLANLDSCSVQGELASWIRQQGGVHSLEPKAIEGVCGLRNQGATCYMNSLLQGTNVPTPIINPLASSSIYPISTTKTQRLHVASPGLTQFLPHLFYNSTLATVSPLRINSRNSIQRSNLDALAN